MIILSDVDGTLIRNGKIDSDLKLKINIFRENNMFILATGRGKESVRKASQKYGLNFFDYAICSGGACIIDKSYNIISQVTFSKKQLDFIVGFLDDNNFNIILSTEKNTYEIMSNDINFYTRENIYSLTIVSNIISEEFFNHLVRKCNEHQLKCTRNGIYIDITTQEVGKYESMELLQRKLLIPQNTVVYAIGDGENDIEMLAKSSVSFTFKESKMSVKEQANYILEDYVEIFKYI